MFRIVRAARQGNKSSQDHSQRPALQRAAYQQGYYVASGDQVQNPLLRQGLTIPQVQMTSVAASTLSDPDELQVKVVGVSSLVEEAEHLLAKAAQAYDGAASAAGFSTTDSHAFRDGMRVAIPIVFRLTGQGQGLQSGASQAGAQQMQGVESLLQQFGKKLEAINNTLKGRISMELPRQPLALSAMLQTLNSTGLLGSRLETCSHPVVQVLYQAALDRKQSEGRSGRGGLLTGRLRGEGGLLANRPRPIQSLVGGMMGGGRGHGGGAQGKPDDRAVAEEIGSEVCNADLLEFQRLTEQLGQIRDWLHN